MKSLGVTLSSSHSNINLPAQLEQSIQVCIDREPTLDDATATRVQEDLLAIYHRYVSGVDTQLGPFLHALALLEPYIKGQGRKEEWWKLVIRPVLDSFGRRRVEIERATQFISNVLQYDADNDKDGAQAKQTAHFTELVLDSYLARTHMGDGEAPENSLEDEHIASQFEKVLVNFGRQKPQDLLIALDGLIVQTRYRQRALALLSAFVRGQPPHLDLVSKTSLIEHLLQCLMIDTSKTVVQIALTIFIMFLPHVPTSIKAHLPRLFLIYSRLLCWDHVEKPRSEEEYYSPDEEKPAILEKSPSGQEQESRPGWEKLEGRPGDDSVSLDVSYYFTFLYGLFPLNLTNYVKKPRRYLININFPRADQLELDHKLIRSRTGPLRSIHLLHPNFYITTAEEELEDDRWMTSDAADVVAECIGLRVSLLSSAQSPGPPPTSKLPEPPPDASIQLATGADNNNSTNGIEHESFATITSAPSHSKSTKRPPRRPSRPPTGLDPGDSPTLPPATGDSSRRPSTSSGFVLSSEPGKALLQQQLVLLRNELNFERYLKQQHLTHIGQLQRRHIADVTVAASTENLINTNKSLKTKLAKATDAYASLKKETATGRTQSKRFESELSSKVRNLRDAERVWHTEESTIKLELEKARSDCDNLRKLVVEVEARELYALQKAEPMELQAEQVNTLSARVQDLEQQLRTSESKDLEYSRTSDTVEILRLDLSNANLQLQAKDGDLERLRKSYDRRVADLEAQLAGSQGSQSESDGLSPERRAKVQNAIEKAVHTANDRTAIVRRECLAWRHKHAELESRYHELESELDIYRSAADGASATPRSIPVPKRAGTAPLMGGAAHWRNSTGTPTDTDEGSTSSPGRPPRPEGVPPLRRSSRGAANALAAAAHTESTVMSPTSVPIIGSSSAPTKNPPLPVGTALGSPRASGFHVDPPSRPEDTSIGATGSSAPVSGTSSGFYMNKKSAWSVDSFDSGQTGESGKTKGSVKSGKSSGSAIFGKRTEGEAEEERKRREAKRRQPPKQGGLRGLRGLI